MDLVLERLHAMIAFSMDKSGAPASRCHPSESLQQASSISLFEENCATEVSDGLLRRRSSWLQSIPETRPYSTSRRIARVSCSRTTPIPGRKVPDNIPGKAGLCTYIEVEGTFNGEDVLNGDVVYRFYLGEDVTSDFNIFRNSENQSRLS